MKKKTPQRQEANSRLSDGHDEGASLLDFFRRSPLWGAGLDLERDRSSMREVPLPRRSAVAVRGHLTAVR